MNAAPNAWPLSAAATQVLIDLRESGDPITSPRTISRLAAKELVVRGDLRILSIRKRRLRKPSVRVATNPHGPAEQVPPPLDLLVQSLPATRGEELSAVIRHAAKTRPSLYTKDLKAAALAELVRRGLAEQRMRKVMGFWPSSFHGPTQAGREWADRARQDAAAAASLPQLAEVDPGSAFQAARRLGALLLLAPAGMAIAVGLTHKWRDGLGAGIDAAIGAGDHDFLEGLSEAFGDLLGSLSEFGADFDGSFDAIGSAIDSGIDSSVNDGGADGSGGDGGGSDGGGGCGGGCGGS